MIWKVPAEKSFFYSALIFVFFQLGGSVIKYSKNTAHKQWLKETPDTLLNFLKNADLSLAFQTYTIYRPGNSCLYVTLETLWLFENCGKYI